jgi:hypothetical protein
MVILNQNEAGVTARLPAVKDMFTNDHELYCLAV